jgi:hypothetical protein
MLKLSCCRLSGLNLRRPIRTHSQSKLTMHAPGPISKPQNHRTRSVDCAILQSAEEYPACAAPIEVHAAQNCSLPLQKISKELSRGHGRARACRLDNLLSYLSVWPIDDVASWGGDSVVPGVGLLHHGVAVRVGRDRCQLTTRRRQKNSEFFVEGRSNAVYGHGQMRLKGCGAQRGIIRR